MSGGGDGPAPDAEPRRLFRWLWGRYLSAQWPWLAAALALMAVEGATLGLFALLMQPMFDRVFVGGDPGAVWTVGFAVAGLASPDWLIEVDGVAVIPD